MTEGTWELVAVDNFDGRMYPELFACDKCGVVSKALTPYAAEGDQDESCPVCDLLELRLPRFLC